MSRARLAAVVRADLLVRFRRPSTAVAFVLLSAVPYLWIPDPASGHALLQADGARVVYDSAALGMATAALAALFVGLFGFYVVSNAVRRDVATRCGDVLASTRLTSGEYVVGKFAGNVAFLATFTGGFVLTSMLMQLVRGEAPLQPLVFLHQYLLLVPPAIVAVSVLAIVFECLPFLAGRFGDVAYFFLWVALMGGSVASREQGGPFWVSWFDYSGFGLVSDSVRAALRTNEFSLGAATFDASLAPVVFPGLLSDARAWSDRLATALTPLPLLLLARVAFHRFDPARLRRSAPGTGRGWRTRFTALLKPAARRLASVLGAGSTTPTRADAVLTLTASPVVSLVLVGVWVAAFTSGSPALLPAALALLAVVVADVSTRDRRSGTLPLVLAVPALRESYVRWKLGSALLFSLVFMAGPLVVLAGGEAARLPGALAGILLVASGATALGVATGNPKAFVVLFLSAWYVAVNDKGAHPWLDFGAFHGPTAWTVVAGHAALAVVLVVAAETWHRVQLTRA